MGAQEGVAQSCPFQSLQKKEQTDPFRTPIRSPGQRPGSFRSVYSSVRVEKDKGACAFVHMCVYVNMYVGICMYVCILYTSRERAACARSWRRSDGSGDGILLLLRSYN